MTTDEKFDAIIDRLGKISEVIRTHREMDAFVIAGYLHKLEMQGLITDGFLLTENGNKIFAIVEEFDWKPSNESIQNFLNIMVAIEYQEQFRYLILQYRDNRESFLKKLKKFKDGDFNAGVE